MANDLDPDSWQYFFSTLCKFEKKHVKQYAACFEQHMITNNELSFLSHDLLKEVGILPVGHRIRILHQATRYSISNTYVPELDSEETNQDYVSDYVYNSLDPTTAPDPPISQATIQYQQKHKSLLPDLNTETFPKVIIKKEKNSAILLSSPTEEFSDTAQASENNDTHNNSEHNNQDEYMEGVEEGNHSSPPYSPTSFQFEEQNSGDTYDDRYMDYDPPSPLYESVSNEGVNATTKRLSTHSNLSDDSLPSFYVQHRNSSGSPKKSLSTENNVAENITTYNDDDNNADTLQMDTVESRSSGDENSNSTQSASPRQYLGTIRHTPRDKDNDSALLADKNNNNNNTTSLPNNKSNEESDGEEAEKNEEEEEEEDTGPIITIIPPGRPPLQYGDLPKIDMRRNETISSATHKLEKFVSKAFQNSELTARPHQSDCVVRLGVDLMQRDSTRDFRVEDRANWNYLLQHGVGSGKSLTISCLALLLYKYLKEGDKQFDQIIVMNDRKILDTQLWQTVSRFMESNGITGLERALDTPHLKEVLTKKHLDEKNITPVIFTTIQKFAHLVTMIDPSVAKSVHKSKETGENGDLVSDTLVEGEKTALSTMKIAIIVDEAHRSHGRRTTRTLHEFLTGSTRQTMNITYFSFTSTPNAKALQMYGSIRDGTLREPFHCYSLRQAIQDGHVIDVLKNYTTVSMQAHIKPKPASEFPFDDASADVAKISFSRDAAVNKIIMTASTCREMVAQRAEYIVKHFSARILFKKSSASFKAKAIVVCPSRECVVWYKEYIEECIRLLPKKKQFQVVASFSPFLYNGEYIKETDLKVNGVHRYSISRDFQNAESNVKMLIVASKFLTGFDEPKCHTMYIDKKMSGGMLVQTLGRANRKAQGKKDSCIVDFVHSRTHVGDTFQLFWDKTTMENFQQYDSIQAKFHRVSNALLCTTSLKEEEVANCYKALMQETLLDPSTWKIVIKQIRKYLDLCDLLQSEHSELSARKLENLLSYIEQHSARTSSQEFLQKCRRKMDIHISKDINTTAGSISVKKNRASISNPLLTSKTNSRTRSLISSHQTEEVSVSELIQSASEQLQQSKSSNHETQFPTLPAETLEFASNRWSTNNYLRNSQSNLPAPNAQTLERIDLTNKPKVKREPETSPTIIPPAHKVSVNIKKEKSPSTSNPKHTPNPSSDTPLSHSSDSTEAASTNEVETNENASKGIHSIRSKFIPRVVEVSGALNDLESDDPDTCAAALKTLRMKMKSVRTSDQRYRQPQLIEKLMQYITQPSSPLTNTEVAFEILVHYCSEIMDAQELIKFGIYNQFYRFVSTEMSDIITLHCLKLVKFIAQYRDHGQSVVDADIVFLIYKLVNSEQREVQREALHIASYLSHLDNSFQNLFQFDWSSGCKEYILNTKDYRDPSLLRVLQLLQLLGKSDFNTKRTIQSDFALRQKISDFQRDCDNDTTADVRYLSQVLNTFFQTFFGNNTRNRKRSFNSLKNSPTNPPSKRPAYSATHSIKYSHRTRPNINK